jgi:hypothetical protein
VTTRSSGELVRGPGVQVIDSREEHLQNRRGVGLAIADHQIDGRPLLPIDPGTPALQRAAEAGSGYFQEDVSQTLRSLERDGLVQRTVCPQVPPKTEYRLTDKGHGLREPIAWRCVWGIDNCAFIDGIIKARAEAVPTGNAQKP